MVAVRYASTKHRQKIGNRLSEQPRLIRFQINEEIKMNPKNAFMLSGLAMLSLPTYGQALSTYDVIETREFSSPPETVWAAWTNDDMIGKWWGPSGFTAPKVELDLNVGAATLVCMQGAGTPLMCRPIQRSSWNESSNLILTSHWRRVQP